MQLDPRKINVQNNKKDITALQRFHFSAHQIKAAAAILKSDTKASQWTVDHGSCTGVSDAELVLAAVRDGVVTLGSVKEGQLNPEWTPKKANEVSEPREYGVVQEYGKHSVHQKLNQHKKQKTAPPTGDGGGACGGGDVQCPDCKSTVFVQFMDCSCMGVKWTLCSICNTPYQEKRFHICCR